MPTKPMTPHQVYREVCRRAKAAKQSLRAYCAARNSPHSTVSKWKGKHEGSVYSEVQSRLLGDVRRKRTTKK